MNTDNYVANSLELHLFFGRIMKEHSLFLKAGFTPVNAAFSNRAEFFKREFEMVLSQAVFLASGVVSESVLCSGELITEFTPTAEKQTERLTGIRIDRSVTGREQRLIDECAQNGNAAEKCGGVRVLNRRALSLLNGLIAFKEQILKEVLRCNIFTMNYPLLIEHIIREAKLYREYIQMLERNCEINCQSMKDIECFWNRIMMEHAMFIRGLLDPTEADLIKKADGFTNEYAALLESCCGAHNKMMGSDSLEKTIKFRDFKSAGAKGIEECRIRSVILPLLADHVLREANRYIRLLK